MKTDLRVLALLGAFVAFQAHAEEKYIDWSLVPGSHGLNDVSRDFAGSPEPLNDLLSNQFTAWDTDQLAINQANTSTGRAQRRALIATQAPSAATEVVSYNETVTTTQAAPSTQNLYSENTSEKKPTTNTTANTTANATVNATQTHAQLASHALIMESSLSSAIEQVKGLKGELNASKSESQRGTGSYQAFIHEMRNDINVARTHEKQLLSGAKKFQDLAQSSELKDVPPAIQQLRGVLHTWEAKTSHPHYWKNQNQAKSDLDVLEKQLSNALEKVKAFSSGKLNASVG